MGIKISLVFFGSLLGGLETLSSGMLAWRALSVLASNLRLLLGLTEDTEGTSDFITLKCLK